MKTLVTAGCSYTKYNYKTWADYLSEDYDRFFNFGMPGSCPKYAYLKILKYIDNYKENLEHTDIIIQWSSLIRHFMLNSEVPYGQIDNNPDFDDYFISYYFNIEEKAIDLLNYVDHITLLSEKYNFKLSMFFMFEPWVLNHAGEPSGTRPILNKQIKNYKKSDVFNILRNIYNNKHWISPSLEMYALKNERRGPYHKNKRGDVDTHPTTSQHRMYVQHIIRPQHYDNR